MLMIYIYIFGRKKLETNNSCISPSRHVGQTSSSSDEGNMYVIPLVISMEECFSEDSEQHFVDTPDP